MLVNLKLHQQWILLVPKDDSNDFLDLKEMLNIFLTGELE